MKFFTVVVGLLVLISELPRILTQLKLSPPWITIVQHVNENYIVKCESEGEKTWKHDNVLIGIDKTGPYATLEKTPHENALYLRFNKIQKEFRGFYNCTTTINGNKYTRGFELIVIQQVTFTNTHTNDLVICNEGDTIVLDCDTEGEPAPIISWFFNNELIPETDNNAHVLLNNSLKIVNASWKNSGIYICRAFQKILQTRDAELVYIVKIRHKPISYLGQLKSSVYGFRNMSKNITCQVHAYPAAYFIWFRDNIPVDPKKHHVKIYNGENMSALEILLQNTFVLGTYNCEASNPLGLLIHRTELQLISKPVIPKLLIYEYSDDAAIISVIVEPYPTYDFKCFIDCTEYTYCSYEEKWKRGKRLQCKNERIVNTNKTHCKIEQLKPLTKYAVRATIVNNGGFGNFSQELIFRTRKEVSMILLNSASVSLHTTLVIILHTMVLLVANV